MKCYEYLFRYRKRDKGNERLERIRTTNEIIDRLRQFQQGRVFNVDTASLKWHTPCITVTENADGVLLFVREVAALASCYDRKLVIRIQTKITYFIY